MSRLSTTDENTALDAILVPSTSYNLAVHTGDPATTGANEVVGGSYARRTIQYGSASSGSKTTTDVQNFLLMPSCTIGWLSNWTTGGAYKSGGLLGATLVVPAGATVAFAIGSVSASLS